MIRYVFVIGVALVSARESSCGGGPEPSPSGANAPCTRGKDCRRGLVCAKGVCATPAGSSHDADADADGDGQATTQDAGHGD